MTKSKDVAMIKNHVKDLISKSRIEDAFGQLEELVRFNEGASIQLALLSSEFYSLRRSIVEGTKAEEYISRKRNEVSKKLLVFVQDLKEDDFKSILENTEIVKNLLEELDEKQLLIDEYNMEILNLREAILEKEKTIIAINEQFEKLKKESLLKSSLEYKDLGIEDLLARGEGETLEYKLGFNNNIMKAVSRTIIAFMNTNGGTILIGVDDTGQVVGLDSASPKVIDKLLTQLFSDLRKNTGSSEILTHVLTDLYKIDDKLILRVDCASSSFPIYYKNQKNECETEEFIIRTGSMNTKIKSISEIMMYVRKRFV